MKRSISLLLVLLLLAVPVPAAHADEGPDAKALLQSVAAQASSKPDSASLGAWSVITDGQKAGQQYVTVQTSAGNRLMSVSPDAQTWTPQAAIKGGELYVKDPSAGWQDGGAYLKAAENAGAHSPANNAFDFLGLAEQAASIAANAEVLGSEQVDGVDTVRIRVTPDANKLNGIFHRIPGGKTFNPDTDAYMVDAGSFSFWVDANGAVRKGSFAVHLLASTKGVSGQETHDVEYRATYLVTPGAQSITWPELPAPGTAQQPSPPPATGKANYTVMVFMNGTDLESKGANATKDLQEMQGIGSTPAVNVVVETLGTNTWHMDGISNQSNQRWLVRKDGLELVADNLGIKPVGDPATLTDFIAWSMDKYPADKYVLIFWDHGGGPGGGFGFDEVAPAGAASSLSLNNIQKAISDATGKTGNKFELIGFDACLMGGIETAAMLSPYGKYLVASEEVEPGHGWWYTHFLKALNNDPTMGGDKLGALIVDSFKAQASSPAWNDAAEITLSVVDLSKASGVVTALEHLVGAAGADVGDVTRLEPVLKARSRTEDYGNGHGALDLADLGDLAKGLAANYADAAAALQQALKDAVVYKLTSTGKPHASGLSVFFPYKNKGEMPDRVASYQTLAFSQAYRQFVDLYATTYSKDTNKVEFAQAQPSGDGRSRSVKIKPEEANQVDQIYSVVARAKDGDPNTILFLGMDNDVQLDPETGEINDSFTGQSVTLNGHFVSMFYEGDAGDYASYSIPIKLRGQQVDLKVLFNYKTGKSEVVGAWPGMDPLAHQPAKEIIKLKDGDRITPLFQYVNTATGKDGYESGAEFTLKGPPRLYWADLPAGDYLYGYYVVDTAQNDSFSEFTTMHTDGPVGQGTTRVVADAQQLSFDVPPQVMNGRTLVPLRAIFEALGAKVDWDAATRTVTATKDDVTIKLQIDNPVAQRNGKPVKLDQAPVVVSGRTMVPVRFVSEALGARVTWDGDTRTVIIDSKP